MTRNLMKGFALFVAAAMLAAAGQALANGYGKQKVVYHINYDDPKAQTGALRNVQNHINAVGAENLDLKVVLHGNGLALLVTPDALGELPKFKHGNANATMAATIDNLRGQGVQFQVCNNTVVGRDVDVAKHLHFVEDKDIVPSGVAELAHLQAQGYTYIKP